jgi:hypothetical protein
MLERKDVEAALEARRELGKEYEPELIESFLQKIDAELAERKLPAPVRPDTAHQGPITPLILGTTALGIPVTAIATSNGGTGGNRRRDHRLDRDRGLELRRRVLPPPALGVQNPYELSVT